MYHLTGLGQPVPPPPPVEVSGCFGPPTTQEENAIVTRLMQYMNARNRAQWDCQYNKGLVGPAIGGCLSGVASQYAPLIAEAESDLASYCAGLRTSDAPIDYGVTFDAPTTVVTETAPSGPPCPPGPMPSPDMRVGRGCGPGMPEGDELALVLEIDAINSRRWQLECECKKLEGAAQGGCMASVAQGISAEINAVQARLEDLCASRGEPPPPPPPPPPETEEEAAARKRSTMMVGGIVLLLVLAGGYAVYRARK